MITLYLEAPFAACRTFTAGWYRPTATFLTPSAIYGLLLNVAGIESRLREEHEDHDGSAAATLTVKGLPSTDLAVGVPTVELRGKGTLVPIQDAEMFPRVQTVFQQLHNYPVGASGKEKAEACKGNKYNITPVRREFLSDIRAVIALRSSADFENRICQGLAGQLNSGRYGVPFLGDNSFLPDRLEKISAAIPTRWFEQLGPASEMGMRDRAARLTISVDRAHLSRTTSGLFAPTTEASSAPSDNAWIQMGEPQ
ncbi:MAG: type I-MYXAN CRISPR-associated protein Cas5/Cmx5/DevS [Planctomycetaceae bacterium]